MTESPQIDFDNSTTLINPDYQTAFVAKIDSFISTGVFEIIHGDGWLSVYPNPVCNEMIIKSDHVEILAIEIYNMHGALVLKNRLQGFDSKVDDFKLPQGIYLLKSYGQRESASMKFVKM